MSSGPTGERTIRVAHAGRRNCDTAACRARYRAKVYRLALGGISDAMVDGVPARLVTLTLPARIKVNGRMVEPRGLSSYRYMARSFNRFMRNARRRWAFDYFRVVEEQRRGAPHYHVVCIGFDRMDQRELSRMAERAGLGAIVDVRLIRSPRAAASYVAKYVTKSAGAAATPERLRFFTRSRRFGASSSSDYLLAQRERAVGWSHAYITSGQSVVVGELLSIGYSYLYDDT